MYPKFAEFFALTRSGIPPFGKGRLGGIFTAAVHHQSLSASEFLNKLQRQDTRGGAPPLMML
jgi:hypothetical protein